MRLDNVSVSVGALGAGLGSAHVHQTGWKYVPSHIQLHNLNVVKKAGEDACRRRMDL